MPQAVLAFDDLTLGYDGHAAVHHLNGRVQAGALIAVVGGNGSGKSTLLKGIAGLLKPMTGKCTVTAPRVAYLPQICGLDRGFPARVSDLVGLGLWPRRGLFGRHRAEDRQRVSDALMAVGLQGFEARPLDALSGGQLQRALFARAIVQDADLILLDEPFNAVDERTVEDLLHLVAHWHTEGRTVLAVLHDLSLVRAHFPQAVVLARELIAWGPVAEVLSPAVLRKARAYQEAWDDASDWCAPEDAHADKRHPDKRHPDRPDPDRPDPERNVA